MDEEIEFVQALQLAGTRDKQVNNLISCIRTHTLCYFSLALVVCMLNHGLSRTLKIMCVYFVIVGQVRRSERGSKEEIIHQRDAD